eukprot:bmy_13862T0
MGSCARLLLLWGCSAVAAGLSGVAGVSSRCEKACNPRMGNLALGRKLWADTTCGQNATELYCFYSENTDLTCQQPKCDKCNAAQPHLAHLPAAMADSSFRFPRTWWQSAEDVHREKIQLDLEAEFYFTHLIMVFKSPRPAAMVLDRSQDFGKTWKPYKYFATNCSATFGLEDDVVKKGAICTSRYSNPFPCTGGEVIFRALSPPYDVENPYSAKLQEQLKITNLRVQLLKRQSCPCQRNNLNAKPQHFTHYAIYDFIVKGSCFCNGHADQCIPVDGFRPVKAPGAFHVGESHWEWVSCICFSPNSSNPIIISCARDKLVKVWNLEYCKLKSNHISPPGHLNTVTVSPDGSLCASEGNDGQAMLWHLNKSKHLYMPDGGDIINSLCFSLNHCWLCATMGPNTQLWDLEGKVIVNELKQEVISTSSKAEPPQYTSLTWSADGKSLKIQLFSTIFCQPTKAWTVVMVTWMSRLCTTSFKRALMFVSADPMPRTWAYMVHGKCMCKHNTAGTHCQHCAPLYNDHPWEAADGKTGSPKECRTCKCNGHADACHFDINVWEASGNRSGGICNDCQHNTEGQHCQRCKPGFYRDLRRPFSAPDACKYSFEDLVVIWKTLHAASGEKMYLHISLKNFCQIAESSKCECKEQVLRNSKAFCGMKYSYGLEYLVAGHEDVRTGKLVVNMKSFVQHWKPSLGRKVMDILKRECK